MNIHRLGRTACLAALAALCACAGGKKAAKDAAAAAAAARAAASTEEPRIRGSLYVETSELAAIRFDYDRDALTAEARAALKRNAAAIKENRSWEVLVEGHCDERGTIPYNLALGQKRAKAVRDYYLALGIPGGRIATLSLGKEKPECPEANEACWQRNRRALSKVKAALAGKPGAPKRHE
ncbi:MAG: OmpA family protein [Elusimicrobia bacterium]|nr:OmpA family protein [Elusimicrobiota bacterium]